MTDVGEVALKNLIARANTVDLPSLATEPAFDPIKVPDTEFIETLLRFVIADEDVALRNNLSSLRGQIVADIGAGHSCGGYELCQISGAKGYIGVEPFYFRSLKESIQEYTRTFVDEKRGDEILPWTIVGEDMPKFLKRLPRNSVSILASGIDVWSFIGANTIDIPTEIVRVLHPGGAFICYESGLRLEASPKLNRTDLISWSSGSSCYTKRR